MAGRGRGRWLFALVSLVALGGACTSHDAIAMAGEMVDAAWADIEARDLPPWCDDVMLERTERDRGNWLPRDRPITCETERLDHAWVHPDGPCRPSTFTAMGLHCWVELEASDPAVEPLLAMLEHEPAIERRRLPPELELPALDRCRMGGNEYVVRAVRDWRPQGIGQNLLYLPDGELLEATYRGDGCPLEAVPTVALVRVPGVIREVHDHAIARPWAAPQWPEPHGCVRYRSRWPYPRCRYERRP